MLVSVEESELWCEMAVIYSWLILGQKKMSLQFLPPILPRIVPGRGSPWTHSVEQVSDGLLGYWVGQLASADRKITPLPGLADFCSPVSSYLARL